MINLALALLLAAPARAGNLKTVRAEGATLGAWAQAVTPVLEGVRGAALPLNGPDLPSLAQWDFNRPSNHQVLAPLVAALEARGGLGLDPAKFKALSPIEQERALNAALDQAGQAAASEAREVLGLVGDGSDIKGPEFLLRRAKGLLEVRSAYLLPAQREALHHALTALRNAVHAEREGRVNDKLKSIRGRIESDQPTVESGLVQVQAAAPAAPVVDDPGFYNLALAASNDEPLVAARRDRMLPVMIAARKGDSEQFWQRADEAMRDLGRRIEKDGLAEIRRAPVGPWAEARLLSYERMAATLWDELRRIHDRHRLEDRPTTTRAYAPRDFPVAAEIPHEPEEAFRVLINKIRAARAKQESRRMAAVDAGKTIERYERERDADIAAPLAKAVDFHLWQVAEAERSSDPHHRPDLAARVAKDRWSMGVPTLREIESAYNRASAAGVAQRLREFARIWVGIALLSLAAAGAMSMTPLWPLLLAIAGASGALAFYWARLRVRFLALGADLKKLSSWR